MKVAVIGKIWFANFNIPHPYDVVFKLMKTSHEKFPYESL